MIKDSEYECYFDMTATNIFSEDRISVLILKDDSDDFAGMSEKDIGSSFASKHYRDLTGKSGKLEKDSSGSVKIDSNDYPYTLYNVRSGFDSDLMQIAVYKPADNIAIMIVINVTHDESDYKTQYLDLFNKK